MFLFSVIINLPLFFITIPGCVDVTYGSTILKNYFNRQTEFSSSNLGKIITSIVYFIRDILTLAAKIVLNIISVYLIKKYFYNLSLDSTKALPSGSIEIAVSKKDYMTKVDRNLTFIAIIMSVLSSLENIFYIIFYVYLFLNFSQIVSLLYLIALFLICLKHSSNLIILYLFNSVFRQEFKKIFLWFRRNN